MLTIDSAEINWWLSVYFLPLVRVLALFAIVPTFSNPALQMRSRLIIGLAVTVAIAPILPRIPALDPASARGMLIMAEQVLIGFAMGLSMRLFFVAIDLAGNIISTQTGLGFAMAYDPQNASQSPVISEILSMLALLSFLAMDGHLMILSVLVQSFSALPIGVMPDKTSWLNIAGLGGIIFSSGLMLALPVIAALLATNVALGVLSRLAPQLSLMSIGFPITIIMGFVLLQTGMRYLGAPLAALFEQSVVAMLAVFVMR